MNSLFVTLLVLAAGASSKLSCVYPLVIKETYQSTLSFCETYQESLSRHELSARSLGSYGSALTAAEAEYFLADFKELRTHCFHREITYTLLPEGSSGFPVLEGKGVDLIVDAGGDIPCGRGEMCRAKVVPRTRIAAHVFHRRLGRLVKVFVETGQPVVDVSHGKVFGAGGRSVCDLSPGTSPAVHSR